MVQTPAGFFLACPQAFPVLCPPWWAASTLSIILFVACKGQTRLKITKKMFWDILKFREFWNREFRFSMYWEKSLYRENFSHICGSEFGESKESALRISSRWPYFVARGCGGGHERQFQFSVYPSFRSLGTWNTKLPKFGRGGAPFVTLVFSGVFFNCSPLGSVLCVVVRLWASFLGEVKFPRDRFFTRNDFDVWWVERNWFHCNCPPEGNRVFKASNKNRDILNF